MEDFFIFRHNCWDFGLVLQLPIKVLLKYSLIQLSAVWDLPPTGPHFPLCMRTFDKTKNYRIVQRLFCVFDKDVGEISLG